MKIAINGCGVAGPALAFWLLKAGHQPTLIEQAPAPRSGGYVVDFWGIGYDIAEKMGLAPQLRQAGYQVGEVRFVDAKGRKAAGFSTEVFRRLTGGRFTSLRRSDLAAVLYSALEDRVETIFSDSIAAVEEQAGGVRVSFDRGTPRAFDLVIGADGLHSRVRAMVFGPQEQFETRLGFHVAAFDAKGYRPRDELVYLSHARPGRQISRFSMRDDRTLFLFVLRDEQLDGLVPTTPEACKAALRRVFGKDGWECTKILAALDAVEDVYFDRVSQVRMRGWVKGRTALIGDAAACVSLLAGEGTGLAIAEAYVLAGELVRSGGDHAAAFAAYQERMMRFLLQKQEAAKKFASSFAPGSALGIAVRNLAIMFLRIPFMADLLVGRDLRDDIVLPHYVWRG